MRRATCPGEASGALVIDVDREYDGDFEERLAAAELPLSFEDEDVGVHVIKLRVTDSTGRQASALAHVEVVPMVVVDEPKPNDEPEPNDEPDTGEVAGGCGVQGGERDLGGTAIGAAALALLIALRSRRERRHLPRL